MSDTKIQIKLPNGNTLVMNKEPGDSLERLHGHCARCNQMELEYVELMNQYDVLKKDYDKAVEEIGEFRRKYGKFIEDYYP